MMNDCGTINAREKKKDWHKKLSCDSWIDMAVTKYYLDIYYSADKENLSNNQNLSNKQEFL